MRRVLVHVRLPASDATGVGYAAARIVKALLHVEQE
jgi:hypothetical protein